MRKAITRLEKNYPAMKYTRTQVVVLLLGDNNIKFSRDEEAPQIIADSIIRWQFYFKNIIIIIHDKKHISTPTNHKGC